MTLHVYNSELNIRIFRQISYDISSRFSNCIIQSVFTTNFLISYSIVDRKCVAHEKYNISTIVSYSMITKSVNKFVCVSTSIVDGRYRIDTTHCTCKLFSRQNPVTNYIIDSNLMHSFKLISILSKQNYY